MTPSRTDFRSPILREAALLFARKGYRGASMRDIGQAIGVHAGSLYVHIENKEGLLYEIVSNVMDRSEADMAEVRKSGAPAGEQLRMVARKHLAMISGNREFATVYFHEWRNLSPDQQAKVIASRDRWEADLRSIMEDGMASGEFRPMDVRLASIAFASIVNWTYQWLDPQGEFDSDRLADEFVDMFVVGLAVRYGKRRDGPSRTARSR